MGPGNIGHLSKTFPLEPSCNIFKVSMSYNIVKLRRMHMKRKSFDNCYIQEPVYWLVLMPRSMWSLSDGQTVIHRYKISRLGHTVWMNFRHLTI